MLKCKYCAIEVVDEELSQHETQCLFRKYECDCGEKILFNFLVNHKRNVCWVSSVDCPLFESRSCSPSCTGLVRRCDLNEHVAAAQGKTATPKRFRPEDLYYSASDEPVNKHTRITDHSAELSGQPSVIEDDDDYSSVISTLTSNSDDVINLTDSVTGDQEGIKIENDEEEEEDQYYEDDEHDEEEEEQYYEESDEGGQSEDDYGDKKDESDKEGVVVLKEKYTGPINAAGQKHGKGRLQYVSAGCIYYGDFQNDQRHGVGIMTQVNIDCMTGGMWTVGTYWGEWSEDFKHGIGTHLFANGDVYEGNYHMGRINGQGKMIYVDGAIYEGEWDAEFWHGRGISTDTKGITKEGVWVMGKFQEPDNSNGVELKV